MSNRRCAPKPTQSKLLIISFEGVNFSMNFILIIITRELYSFLKPDSRIIFLIKPNLLNTRNIIPSSLAIHNVPADNSMIAQTNPHLIPLCIA